MRFWDYLQMPIFQTAFFACLLCGAALSVVGNVVIQFQLTTVRFALMHLALLGGSAGLLVGTDPLWGAMAAIVLGSMLFGPMSGAIRLDPSATGAFLMTGSLAIALMLFYVADVPAMKVFGLFTGSILTLTKGDLWLLGIVSAVIVVFFVVCYREIQLVFNDPEQSQWLGIPANAIRNVLLFLTGISIGISMKVVGALLIDAIVLLPAMAAAQLSSGFSQTLWLSTLFGIITTIGGFALSLAIDLPTGATITMTGVIVFGFALIVKQWNRFI